MTDAPGPPPSSDAKIPRWKLVLWAAIALYAILLLVLNDAEVPVRFVFFKVTTRLPWLILLSMALGAALAIIGPRWWRSRKR